MTFQHREFQSRLRDVERLRLYVQSVVFDHKALSASLAEVESTTRRWENEAKESIEKMARAKAKRNAARHDALMAHMDAARRGVPGRRLSPSCLGSRMPWRLQRRLGGRQKIRLVIWPTNESLYF